MLTRIINELNEAMDELWEDNWRYAYHTGRAGGIAAAMGARGFFVKLLCDEISDAYEMLDLAVGEDDDFDDFDPEEYGDATAYAKAREMAFWVIIEHLGEEPNEDNGDHSAAGPRIGWEEYGVALSEAVQAKADGDSCATLL